MAIIPPPGTESGQLAEAALLAPAGPPDGAGPLTAAMGLLSRRSELEALVGQIAQEDERIEQLGRELNDAGASSIRNGAQICSTGASRAFSVVDVSLGRCAGEGRHDLPGLRVFCHLDHTPR